MGDEIIAVAYENIPVVYENIALTYGIIALTYSTLPYPMWIKSLLPLQQSQFWGGGEKGRIKFL
jgi:hypothetical protein